MTPDLWKTLIGAIVLLLTAVAAYVKMRTEIDKIKAQRADTKQERDRDSETLHDQCKKNSWEIDRLKEDNSRRDSLLDSVQRNVNELNTNLLLVSQELRIFSRSITNAIKELKDEKKRDGDG